MKRKLLSVLLVLALIASLVSCDGVVDFMGKMGSNVMGADEKQAAAAVETVTKTEVKEAEKVEESEKTKESTNPIVTETKTETNQDGSTTTTEVSKSSKVEIDENAKTVKYTDSTGASRSLFTVGKVTQTKTTTTKTTTTSKTEEGSDGKTETTTDESKEEKKDYDNAVVLSAEVVIPVNDSKDVEKLATVLPPQDLTTVKESLEGSSKDKVVEELKKEVEKGSDTEKAAQGTATLMKVTIDAFDEDSEEESEGDKKVADNVNNAVLRRVSRDLAADGKVSQEESSTETAEPPISAEDVNKILDKLKANIKSASNGELTLTNGDILILKSFTNLVACVTENIEKIMQLVEKYQNAGADVSVDDAIDEVSSALNSVVDSAMETITIFMATYKTSAIFYVEGYDFADIIQELMDTYL